MELFGLRLKALRQGKGLTQSELAQKLGVVKASV
ncbi:MAG: helix-turn-helix domain-containing protein, partial [Clostridiales bacterium]|nr:helix-turn-helix domain-containing protein [Clostridiales bacterium]